MKLYSYFPSLNALRFFAAFLVVLLHAEGVRAKQGLANLRHISVFHNGSLAVEFFFVLSGFLISYLLLKEFHQTKTVAIKKFYMRRILRIWPLYFLLVFIGICLFPITMHVFDFNYEIKYPVSMALPLYLLFLPFVVNALYATGPLLPLWSIGVEEQFYLIWAPIMKKFRKHFPWICLVIILLKLTSYFFFQQAASESKWFYVLGEVNQKLKFEAMAIGGLAAYWIFIRPDIISKHFLFSRTSQAVFLTLIFIRVFLYREMRNALPELYEVYHFIFMHKIWGVSVMSFLFVWLILNLSLNKRRLFHLEYQWLNKLGDISYGIYMYHMIFVFIVVMLLKNSFLKMDNVFVVHLGFYAILIPSILICSWLSYQFFERPFLKLKKKIG